jgi:hypothetical protein
MAEKLRQRLSTRKDGQPRKRAPGGGRKPGSVNKVTHQIRNIAQKMVNDPTYRKELRKRLHAGDAPQLEIRMWEYAYGKPKETLELNCNLSALSDEELNNLESLVSRISN